MWFFINVIVNLFGINLFLFINVFVCLLSLVFFLIVVWNILFVEICGMLNLFIMNCVCVFLFVFGVFKRIIFIKILL